jgi:hypothetical protein
MLAHSRGGGWHRTTPRSGRATCAGTTRPIGR